MTRKSPLALAVALALSTAGCLQSSGHADGSSPAGAAESPSCAYSLCDLMEHECSAAVQSGPEPFGCDYEYSESSYVMERQSEICSEAYQELYAACKAERAECEHTEASHVCVEDPNAGFSSGGSAGAGNGGGSGEDGGSAGTGGSSGHDSANAGAGGSSGTEGSAGAAGTGAAGGAAGSEGAGSAAGAGS